jgi:hypothetical protein
LIWARSDSRNRAGWLHDRRPRAEYLIGLVRELWRLFDAAPFESGITDAPLHFNDSSIS